MLILAMALCMAACKKEQVETVPAVTQQGEADTAAQAGEGNSAEEGSASDAGSVNETETESEEPAILENEGELEIVVPEGQDSFGE